MKIEDELKDVKDEMIINVVHHLIEKAASDPLIIESLNKPNKSVKELEVYLKNEALKMYNREVNGGIGLERSTVYGWAQHYYDEDSIVMNKPSSPTKKEKKQEVVKPKIELPENDFDVFDF